MQYDTILYNMVPYCTIWYHIVQYGTILCNMVPYCTIWYHIVQYVTLVLPARPLNSCFVACSAVESLSEVIEVWFPLLDCWMSLKDSSVDLLGVEILQFLFFFVK